MGGTRDTWNYLMGTIRMVILKKMTFLEVAAATQEMGRRLATLFQDKTDEIDATSVHFHLALSLKSFFLAAYMV